MNSPVSTSPAEQADRITLAIALSMFFVSIMFAVGVAEFFAEQGLAAVLDIAGKALAVSAIVVILSTYLGAFRKLSDRDRKAYLDGDGFLQSSFRRALSKSWMLVFVALALLQALDHLVLDRLPAMPVEIVLQSVLTLMLISFSVAFALIIRSDDDDESNEHVTDFDR